jgi:hypothetical protein
LLRADLSDDIRFREAIPDIDAPPEHVMAPGRLAP